MPCIRTTNTVSQGLIDGEKDALGYAIWGMPSLPCWFSCSMLNAQSNLVQVNERFITVRTAWL